MLTAILLYFFSGTLADQAAHLKMQVHFDPDIINLENSINVIIEQESRKNLIEMGVEKVKSIQ